MNKITEIISGLTVEQIIDIVVAICVMILFRALSSTVAEVIVKIFMKKTKERKKPKANPFYLPLKTVITFIGIYIAINILINTLQMSVQGAAIVTKITRISLIAFVAKAFGEWLDVKDGVFKKIKSKNDKELDETTTKLIFRTIKIIIYIIAGFMIISELGYNISGFITGLGISGIVITLAAQDTAKSIIGGIAIFIDRPFKIGDYIKVGEHEGTVEEIKFRSTSIRTLENSVLHIPNSEMSTLAIVNYSEIVTRRYYTELVIKLNTELKSMNNLEKRIKNMLESNEYVVKGTEHVNFEKISDNGMNMMISAYVYESEYFKFLDIKEIINYKIVDILREENIELAYNTQTVHLKNES